MLISILIPCFNEEKTIKELISKVKKAKLPGSTQREIIVVDDASTDKTKKILKSIKGIKIFEHTDNNGKGAAVLTAIKKSKGDILIIQDADLEYNPKYYVKLLIPFWKNKAEVVYGTRLKNYPLKFFGVKRTPLISHFLGNKFLSFATGVIYGKAVSDMETGYKLFSRDAINGININAKRFDFEAEFTAKIIKKGIKIYEVPIKINPRGYDEGKKITWKDGLLALLVLFKYRFTD